MQQITLDTSVIIEFIDKNGSLHYNASLIFDQLKQSSLFGYVSHPTLAETFYVSYRLYDTMKLTKPFKQAENLVEWLYAHPSIEVADSTFDLLREVAKAKIDLKLSLSDCYVLATSKFYNAKAIFKKREKEMTAVLNQIKKNYDILFLEDF